MTYHAAFVLHYMKKARRTPNDIVVIDDFTGFFETYDVPYGIRKTFYFGIGSWHLIRNHLIRKYLSTALEELKDLDCIELITCNQDQDPCYRITCKGQHNVQPMLFNLILPILAAVIGRLLFAVIQTFFDLPH